MNKKVSLGAAIAMMAIIAAATFSITMVYSRQVFNNTVLKIKEREATFSKLSEINQWVRSKYYGDINEDKLMDSIAQGYVSGIGDPYAKYYPVEEYTRISQSGTSKAVGVGMVCEIDESGYIRVTEVYPESPALAAGVAVGDLIVKIGDTDLNAKNVEEIFKTIEGEAGTKIDIVTRRDNVDTPLPLTRRNVEKPSVYASMTEGKIGYIQILDFNSTTSDQFTRGIDRLVSEGALSFVFDVRNNPGSTTDSATRILDKLLPQCDIVTAVYKDGTTDVLSTSDSANINLPMTVLVNENTASAAELFAQDLKDVNSAQIVGMATTGKGTMQSIQQLSDGSAVDITVAKYSTPGGQSFDGVGVKPDFEVKVSKEQANVIAKLVKNNIDNVLLALEMDPQLKKAIELASTAANVASGGASSARETPDESASAGEGSTPPEAPGDGGVSGAAE